MVSGDCRENGLQRSCLTTVSGSLRSVRWHYDLLVQSLHLSTKQGLSVANHLIAIQEQVAFRDASSTFLQRAKRIIVTQYGGKMLNRDPACLGTDFRKI